MSTKRTRFSGALMHRTATLYYLEDATQADIAARLGVSRASVSRLLSEARREGIVRIEVVAPPDRDMDELELRVAGALGLDAVWLSRLPARGPAGERLAPALSTALQAVGLVAGDVLLVSSGRTVYEAAQAELPSLPNVLLAPMIGGHDEAEAWYAPNEIVRQFALKVGGIPTFLYAPALPGPELHESLRQDPSARRVIEMWSAARCAIMGVGAPPLSRTSLPSFVRNDMNTLQAAVGDVCSRFYDSEGVAVPFPGWERLLATGLEVVQRIPTCIAVAAGREKLDAIRAGSAARYFNQLVTDAETAAALLEAIDR
ncbi:MAG TPA: sugar-binding domain-containing protein [Trueperaceae bacterium]|nr:sugar-binding domain-containing protein [Trueperaceae bacterium]